MDKKLEYVNRQYNKNFKAGQKVKALKDEGTIVGGTNYVFVKTKDGTDPYHPDDVVAI